MTARSWAEATTDLLLAAIGLYVAFYPGFSVAYALATGAPLAAPLPQGAAAVVAFGGSYPFVAGDWSYGRLGRFVAALIVVAGAAGLLGLVALSQIEIEPPSATVARAVVLAIAYPAAAVVAFDDRLPWHVGRRSELQEGP